MNFLFLYVAIHNYCVIDNSSELINIPHSKPASIKLFNCHLNNFCGLGVSARMRQTDS